MKRCRFETFGSPFQISKLKKKKLRKLRPKLINEKALGKENNCA